MHAELLAARVRLAEAQAALEQARDRRPDRVLLGTAQAVAAELQGKQPDALGILDAAEGQLAIVSNCGWHARPASRA